MRESPDLVAQVCNNAKKFIGLSHSGGWSSCQHCTLNLAKIRKTNFSHGKNLHKSQKVQMRLYDGKKAQLHHAHRHTHAHDRRAHDAHRREHSQVTRVHHGGNRIHYGVHKRDRIHSYDAHA